MLRVIVSDTNILINLCYAENLDLLGRLPSVDFIIPTEVEREMRKGRGRRFAGAFSSALNRGVFRVEEAKGSRAVEVYARCRDDHGLDEGESAAMALAAGRGCIFATTDGRAYTAAISELGDDSVIHLEDILELAASSDVLTHEAAMSMRQLMVERNGYVGWKRH